jgi:glycine betaine catabolism B
MTELTTEHTTALPDNLLTATLLQVTPDTPTIKRFVFEVSEQDDFCYLPGQWIDLFLEIDGKVQVGGYSLTSVPGDVNTRIELAIQSSDKHPVTHYLCEEAQPGLQVKISQGQGACVYDPDMGEQLVLIAGGVGITPLMSILRSAVMLSPDAPVALLYSAHKSEDFAFAKEIQALAEQHENVLAVFTCTETTDEPLPDWVHFNQRIDTAFLKDKNLPLTAHYFICGPQRMIAEVEEGLLELAVPAGQIHYEKWH